MADSTDPLVLDLVEWIAREPRLSSAVIETWRTSCPRLEIWEDAVDRGYVTLEPIAGAGVRVAITEDGEKFLSAHGRGGCPLASAGDAPAPSLLRAFAPPPLTHDRVPATFMHPHPLCC